MHDASFTDSLSRLNRRRDAERGFSLIELEPLMIVVLGVVIGGMVIALYLPLFSLYSHLQQQ